MAVGDRSPLGRCVLAHATGRFDVEAVMLPTDEAYERFTQNTSRSNGIRPTTRQRLRKLKHMVVSPPPPAGTEDAVRLSFDEMCDRWPEGEFDLLICAGFPAILPDRALARAHRSVNIHTSLLPQLKGRHPHYWAVEWGLERSGLTAHEMTQEVDSGEIVGQVVVDIPKGTSYHQHYADLLEAVPALLDQVHRWMATGERVQPVEVEPSMSPGEP
jgi:methionyl-tRNA formyltransferase